MSHPGSQRGRVGRIVRRRRTVALTAMLLAATATIAVASSGAYFTSSATTSATGTVAEWAPVTTTATKAGSPAGTQSRLTWGDASQLSWAKDANIPASALRYTVQRSTTKDFSAASSPVTVPLTGMTNDATAKTFSVTDSGTEPAVSAKQMTQVVGMQRSDGMAGLLNGKVYYWGTVWKAEDRSATYLNWNNVRYPTEMTGWGGDVRTLAAGKDHLCGILRDGTVKCVGFNGRGQLGAGAVADTVTPTAISDVNGVFEGKTIVALDAGEFYTCALTGDGTVGCWGDNTYGQLGNKNVTGPFSNVPVLVVDGSNNPFWDASAFKPTMLTTGAMHACVALGPNTRADGTLEYPGRDASIACWGRNNWKQLGTDPAQTATSRIPIYVVDSNGVLSSGITRINAGHAVTCVITNATDRANVACWGGGGYGVLGNGADVELAAPTTIRDSTADASPVRRYTELDIGTTHGCASSKEIITCWGRNDTGQMGNGVNPGNAGLLPPSSRNIPITLGTGNIKTVAVNEYGTCVTNEWGSGACWGKGVSTAQGSTTADLWNPAPILLSATSVLRPPVVAASAYSRLMAMATDGRVYRWGQSYISQTGVGSSAFPTAEMTHLSSFPYDVVQLAVGYAHICALTSQSRVLCQGDNDKGQLGNNSFTSSNSAVALVDNQGVFSGKALKKLVSLEKGACVLALDGRVGCWGDNTYAQLSTLPGAPTNVASRAVVHAVRNYAAGNPEWATIDPSTPTTQPIDIASGTTHVCVAKSAGVACWGGRSAGQTGVAFGGYNPDPQNISDPTNVLAGGVRGVYAGNKTSCALIAESTDSPLGKAYCWGSNEFGVRGDPNANSVFQPQAVDAGTSYRSLSIGYPQSCGSTGAQVRCWGIDGITTGRDSVHTNSTVPGPVTDSNGVTRLGVGSVISGDHVGCIVDRMGGVSCFGPAQSLQNGARTSVVVAVPTSISAFTPSMVERAPLRGEVWGCLSGAVLVSGTSTCTLSPNISYYYRVTYSTAGVTWTSRPSLTARQ